MRMTSRLDPTPYRKAVCVLGGTVLMAVWLMANNVVGAEKRAPAQASALASRQSIDFRLASRSG